MAYPFFLSLIDGPHWGQSPLWGKVFRTSQRLMMLAPVSCPFAGRTTYIFVSSQLNSSVKNSCKPFSSHELIMLFPNCGTICWEGKPAFSLEMLKIKSHAFVKGVEIIASPVYETPVSLEEKHPLAPGLEGIGFPLQLESPVLRKLTLPKPARCSEW